MYFLLSGLKLAQKVLKTSGPKLVDFKNFLLQDISSQKEVEELRKEVSIFASKFPLPGLDSL